jgi:hypothetical protein
LREWGNSFGFVAHFQFAGVKPNHRWKVLFPLRHVQVQLAPLLFVIGERSAGPVRHVKDHLAVLVVLCIGPGKGQYAGERDGESADGGGGESEGICGSIHHGWLCVVVGLKSGRQFLAFRITAARME